ncbi:MerC domain-containing protein [Chitinophaga sp. Cy-1792]|uniref:MerC domain-containing protein n=1 Tax=Chitinophaga sp. Cy-1792 TaxID=2608339 RepID=UPI0014242EF0|nr:MerC domain-containing protein [Chitinophaga sp. Cy-1792]
MRERLYARLNLDALGIGASVLCAVHCALLPLFITAIPLLGMALPGHGWMEYAMLSFSFIVGCFALGRGYYLRHRKSQPLLLFILGFICLVAGHFLHWAAAWEATVIAIGAIIIIIAHLLNIRHTRTCDTHKHASSLN